jgi:paraquat-inducible protein B
VGGFVVGAVVLAASAVTVFGSGRVFSETVPFVVYFDANVSGLDPGAPVKFRGVRVGTVRQVLLNLSGTQRSLDDFRIPVIFEIDMRTIQHRGAVVDLANPAVVDSMIEQGFRATLVLESMVTGKRYIELDVVPDAPVTLENVVGSPYKEIPVHTAPGFAALQELMADILRQVDKVPFDSIFDDVTRTLDSFNAIAASDLPATLRSVQQGLDAFRDFAHGAEGHMGTLSEDLQEVTAELTTAIKDLQATLVSARAQMDPQSPMSVQMMETLEELAGAARAMHFLADYLEQNPSALVRGKEEPKKP